MSFSQIIGQERPVSILQGMINRGRAATSYLFCGEQGIGKKTTALNFAKALNCLQGAADSCDECRSCRKMDSGSHPDLLIITPEERQIRIEEIRAIENALSFRPFEGRKKVVIVDDADAMNIAAANAFLKTLEEPPEDSIIILVTSRPERLPETIRSRCSRINFGPLSFEDCKKALRGRVPDERIEAIARISMGSPGLALSGDLLEDREWFMNLFQGMLRAEKDSWASRDEMEKWFDLCLAFLRDLAVSKISEDGSLLIHGMIRDDRRKDFAKVSNSLSLPVIIKLYQEMNKLKGFLFFNLNKAITWNYTASLLRKEISA